MAYGVFSTVLMEGLFFFFVLASYLTFGVCTLLGVLFWWIIFVLRDTHPVSQTHTDRSMVDINRVSEKEKRRV